MSYSNCARMAVIANVVLLTSLLVTRASAQLVWNQEMDEYSAILPLTLDNNVYRIRAKPPEGITPPEINCDIGITGTVLTDQRGTSAGDPGEKVLGGLRGRDDIDVQFTDRVFTGDRDFVGNRIIEKYDFDCGINVQYENLKKVAQLEIRVGYVLPSGDIEGLTWAKLRRKQRIYQQNIAKCGRYKRDIVDLERESEALGAGDNDVLQMRINARRSGIARQIARLEKYASREEE